MQKALHIYQSSSVGGAQESEGPTQQPAQAKEMSSLQCQNLLKQLTKAAVGHSQNRSKELLKNNFTRLVEMIENPQLDHLAHT